MVAPYSLFVSFGMAVALAPPIYLSHYVSFALIETTANLLHDYILPSFIASNLSSISVYMNLPISPGFVLAFFIFDQGLCFYIHFFTPSKVVKNDKHCFD